MKWTSIAQLTLGFLSSFALAEIDASAAGIHVIYSYEGEEPPEELYDLITKGKVGGVVLYEENIHDGLPAIVEKMQSTWLNSTEWVGSPLLIMTQQEGGEMSTVPGGPNKTAKAVGESFTPDPEIDQMTHQTEQALTPWGINTNLGPVMDIYRKDGDFLDKDERSFSDDPDIVCQCTRNYLTSMFVDTGILAAAKYFPGMGAAAADDSTYEGPVTIDVDLDTLQNIDMRTYRNILSQQVAYQVQMIMTSWATYPALDPERPAGLSEKIVTGELREGMKYKGVIVTDSIEAGALEEFGDDAERAIMAMEAGADIVLATSKNVTQGEVICDAIMEHFDSNSTTDSYYRITDMRELLNPDDYY